ncbi:hypothetical protein E9232_006850 [Inquilinus ginsengisoli]|uniref:Uncharacterized protein n=1 Tax=Inquilinus ginsengisoli TaxID=363840 RepID=A0ABU1K094_9PROT|nr:hypothetical protein [Inquilinus ginsengisoli]MDR6294296.1 hypothetical protein [Inquilinus ginsengisoli]
MVKTTGVKFARIHAKAVYPPVSAWEFEHLKSERVIQERLQRSTIYIIVQRPMLWFDNVYPGNGKIQFDITEGSEKIIHCILDLGEVFNLSVNEAIEFRVEFHRDAPQDGPPYRNVAGIRVFKEDQFLVWWSPQKLLFESTTRGLPLLGAGDMDAFTDYEVQYIGQAFSQTVWDRLTGHTPLQSALTLGKAKGQGHCNPALEIGLITLEISGVEEIFIDTALPFLLPEGTTPVYHHFEIYPPDPRCLAFYSPWMRQGDPEATNELEAMLIRMFEPTWNKIKYKSYPNIKNGARSKGYTMSSLALDDFPFRLKDTSGEEPLMDA